MTFEQLDRSVDADSDSEDEIAEQRHAYKSTVSLYSIIFCLLVFLVPFAKPSPIVLSGKGKSSSNDESLASNQLAGLHISPPRSKSAEARPPPPPRPAAAAPVDDYEEEDENDPFADSNALQTPAVEKDGPRWYVNRKMLGENWLTDFDFRAVI